MKKYIIGIIIFIGIGYLIGVIKLPKNIKDIQNGDINIIDPCFRKKASGDYDMAIKFEQSNNKTYEKQKMEILYSFNINQERCEISGYGEKVGYSVIDTLTDKRQDPKKDKKKIIIHGQIKNDTLILNISFDTPSTDDYQVTAKFPYETENISVLTGKFLEKSKAKSKGSVKLTKKNR